ncbi:hypothetical protein [Sulfitobacter geojensis]|uniref:Uncharacterized protein n=1 Tax=Sulfitobacter geojensis TaxID=1342299 RepID=A0AAE3B834_9RHOB|nr:hypothetical protein [Sulfitobacter geojensis]MBM1691608.1 hypothetical protein [Sulfitobacter geojensis]MBM1695674.1 hypothetical protein [Sulfitobacter geojensis]MBM1707839.1 hypothetical protein [Sulfitobacter geojensis]MBM1711898.1 hypothetical protein [Sulfitobacter geojensis]MBM1715963.1 hypothetical protein [Sulfitobacter geojensis]
MDEKIKKYLGSAFYSAKWVERSNLVRLSATGLLPCSNYLAQLEKRPEKVVPPMWDFVFFAPDSCEKALKVFNENVVMMCSPGSTTIVVHDAAGIHEVAILETHAKRAETSDAHSVFAQFPRLDEGHQGCLIASADTLVSAYYYRAFGPAPLDDCKQFVTAHDPAKGRVLLAGGEVPWPLLA